MWKHALAVLTSAVLIAVAGCDQGANENGQTPEAVKSAGTSTIAAGLGENTRFMAAAKAAGLDTTLAGPGPYTVLVPEDAAFDAAPAGTFATTPENRAQLTGVLTNMILPGTVLAADIENAIEAGDGKVELAAMGGSTITGTREGGRIVLADAAGNKATITKADEQFSNGVVHRVSAVLIPDEQQRGPAATVGTTVEKGK